MEQCPICFTNLEIRDCAPCDDCGWDVPTEMEHLNEKRHLYRLYEIAHDLRLTLCDFCAVDFGSYESEYFGLKGNRRISFRGLKFIKQIDHPQMIKDKFCPECSRRLAFLKFVVEMRRISE